MPRSRSHPGQMLIEVIVAVTILVFMIMGLVRLSVSSLDSAQADREYTAAVFLGVQGLEAARSVAAANFSALTDGNHGLSDASGYYALSGSSDTTNGYTRIITIATATRAGGGQLLDDGSGTPDPLTKRITATIRWTAAGRAIPRTIALTTYLTDWR